MENLNSLLFQFYPFMTQIAEKMKSGSRKDTPAFLFHGSSPGKEWAAIKLIQSLNCQQFNTPEHHILTCPECSRINKMLPEYGFYTILTNMNFNIIQYYLPILQRGTLLEDLSSEAIIHELSKMNILLDIQFMKEKHSSSSKKIGQTKIQEYRDFINQFQIQLSKQDYHLPDIKKIEEIVNILQNFKVEISIEYVKSILERFSLTHARASYRVLMIKDSADLRNQTLVMNTLLKIVEEPPPKLIIVFLTRHLHRILPTIRSRTIQVHFKALLEPQIKILSTMDPLYPIDFLKKDLPKVLLWENISEDSFDLEQQIVQYLEQKYAQYAGTSPLYSLKRKQIEAFLLGIKEYRISPKLIHSILPFL